MSSSVTPTPSTPPKSKSPSIKMLIPGRNKQFEKIKNALTQQKRDQRKARRKDKAEGKDVGPRFEM